MYSYWSYVHELSVLVGPGAHLLWLCPRKPSQSAAEGTEATQKTPTLPVIDGHRRQHQCREKLRDVPGFLKATWWIDVENDFSTMVYIMLIHVNNELLKIYHNPH